MSQSSSASGSSKQGGAGAGYYELGYATLPLPSLLSHPVPASSPHSARVPAIAAAEAEAAAAGAMSQSSSASGSRRNGGGGLGYDGQGSPVAYRTGPLAYTPAVLCECKAKLKACRWICWNDENSGRRYYSCQRSRVVGEDCGFFLWLDDKCSPWYKLVLKDLRDAVWALKKQTAKEEALLQEKEKHLVEQQMELEEKKKQLQEKQHELNAMQEQLRAMEQQLVAFQQQFEAKDEFVQALEAKLKNKNKCIDALVLLSLLMLFLFAIVLVNANKA